MHQRGHRLAEKEHISIEELLCIYTCFVHYRYYHFNRYYNRYYHDNNNYNSNDDYNYNIIITGIII